MADKIHIDGQEISIKEVPGQEDFISLTDMAKAKRDQEPRHTLQAWLKNGQTRRFIEAWESQYNPNFKRKQMATFKTWAEDERNLITIKRYLEMTEPLGIISKSGRYGGTYAVPDIAFNFANWLSPEFSVFLMKDYRRLKSDEYRRNKLEWKEGRFLSKVNYSLQVEAIKENLESRLEGKEDPYLYASEADLINLAVFGKTAKQMREENPDLKGNIRENASLIENIVIANMEALNAVLIEAGARREARYIRLCQMASKQLAHFSKDKRLESDKKFLG